MADSPTTRNRLRKQEVGAKTNAWGGDWNEDGGSDRIDEALDGFVAFSLSGTRTLVATNYESDEARMRVIHVTGGSGGSVVIPAVERWYLVINLSSGNMIIDNGSATVTLATGEITIVVSNGGSAIRAINARSYVDAAILNAAISADLPSQAGNAGKFITTDGTTASWAALTIAALGSITSSELRGMLTDETGSGAAVFGTSPAIAAPAVTGGTFAAPAITDPTITGCILEDIYTITDGAAFEIDPGNGSIQFITLGASRTPKATNFANGESVLLFINDGSAYTISWTDATFGGSGVAWKGAAAAGSAPSLDATNWTVVALTKAGGQVRGFFIGVVA